MSQFNNKIFYSLLCIKGQSSHYELLDQHQPIANHAQHLDELLEGSDQCLNAITRFSNHYIAFKVKAVIMNF